MKQFITQQDEQCVHCDKELPKGSNCYFDDYDFYCIECAEKLEARYEVECDIDLLRGN